MRCEINFDEGYFVKKLLDCSKEETSNAKGANLISGRFRGYIEYEEEIYFLIETIKENMVLIKAKDCYGSYEVSMSNGCMVITTCLSEHPVKIPMYREMCFAITNYQVFDKGSLTGYIYFELCGFMEILGNCILKEKTDL